MPIGDGPIFFINGVPCGLQGLDESVGRDGYSARMGIKCDWLSRGLVIAGLMGGVSLNGTQMTLTPPATSPYFPRAMCTSIGGIKPFTYKPIDFDNNGFPIYDMCIIEANFTVPPWTQFDEYPPFTTLSFNSAPEVFSPPGGSFYMPGLNETPIAESSVGIIRPHCEITMTRELFPYIPDDAIMLMQGCLNSKTQIFFKRSYPVGCLMFIGADAERASDPATGNETYTVSYKFMGNYQVDFNKFFGKDGQYHLLNTKPDGSGNTPFPYVDFDWFINDDLAPPTDPRPTPIR